MVYPYTYIGRMCLFGIGNSMTDYGNGSEKKDIVDKLKSCITDDSGVSLMSLRGKDGDFSESA